MIEDTLLITVGEERGGRHKGMLPAGNDTGFARPAPPGTVRKGGRSPSGATLARMVNPDGSRGAGFGDPEQKQELLEEHQAEMRRELEMAHEAKLIEGAEGSKSGGRRWWNRLFHRSSSDG